MISEIFESKVLSKRLEYFNGEQVEVPAFDWFDASVLWRNTRLLETTTGLVNQEGVKAAAYTPLPPSLTGGARKCCNEKG
jgi:hypothetical protein